MRHLVIRYGLALSFVPLLLLRSANYLAADEPRIPNQLNPWMVAQVWKRDVDGPIVELGESGEFDDTHIFAPCVAFEDGKYRLWYCGSTGRVAERVFHLGLANSNNGRNFQKHTANPVYVYGDSQHSVLTPTLLRSSDGKVMREGGRLRMWFSSTHFAGPPLHTLHETFSENGIQWKKPSESLLANVYAPTIIKDGKLYRMWYTDVSADPWLFRHADSADGRHWQVRDKPVLQVGQNWERGRLFYPTVVKADGVYLMWYGSYWKQQSRKTALGFAVSLDGLTWYKNPHNPVLRPDPKRPWESHYTTSQSVLRMPDGSWRIWFASRKKPPFVNKYFAINTAIWPGITKPGSTID